MNTIKTKDQQNHSASKFFSTSTTMSTRRRHAYLGTTIANSEMDLNSWKQNAAQSQVDQLNFTFIFHFHFHFRKELAIV